jgi:hypothetical protein
MEPEYGPPEDPAKDNPRVPDSGRREFLPSMSLVVFIVDPEWMPPAARQAPVA